MPVDEDDRSAHVAADCEEELGDRGDHPAAGVKQPAGINCSVDVAGALEDPGEGKEPGCRDHDQQVPCRELPGLRAHMHLEPVGQPGQCGRDGEDQTARERQQSPVGHLSFLDAKRAENQHQRGDGIAADTDAGQRRMRGVTRKPLTSATSLDKRSS